jgi:site-specific DNA-methyltransferase (adenine-specific)
MLEINKIYNEDCLTGMEKIDDASIDCILTDPPYLYLKNQ